MKTSWQAALQILCGIVNESAQSGLNLTQLQFQQLVMDFNSAIASCSAAVLVQRAEQIFSGMQEVQIKPSLVTYNTVVSVYQKSSLSDKALGMLQEMEAAQVVADLISYSSAISACEKGRMVNKAFQMFDQMRVKRITPNLISYSALISACEKCSCATDAGEALSQLIVDRLQPDVISFNAAIRAFAKVGDVTSAKDLFWKMKQHNVQPNVVSLNSLLSAYDTPGKDIHDIGSETLRLMEETAAQRIRANVVTFSTLINAYEKHSLWELALTDLAQMHAANLTPNQVAYTAALGACRRSSNPFLAPELYNSMKRDSVKMDVVAYNALIAVCDSNPTSRRYLWRFGFGILQDMRTSVIQPDIFSFNSLLKVCRSVGACASAQMFYKQLREQKLQADAITLDALIETLEMVPAPADLQLLHCMCQTGYIYLASLASIKAWYKNQMSDICKTESIAVASGTVALVLFMLSNYLVALSSVEEESNTKTSYCILFGLLLSDEDNSYLKHSKEARFDLLIWPLDTRDVTIVGALSDLKGALDELGFAGAGLVGSEGIGHVIAGLGWLYCITVITL